MNVHEDILATVGNTPLVRIRTNNPEGARLYLKLEGANPGGSAKDRAALHMLRTAADTGLIQPGGTVVEVTSGNTGVGLAIAAASLGYRAVIFVSAQIAVEKIRLLKAYGADVRLVPGYHPKQHPESTHSRAAKFVAETPGAWRADQYENDANPQAHFTATGPEIWTATDGTVTHFVSTVGTGGTITGTGEYLKAASGGAVTVIGADPEAST